MADINIKQISGSLRNLMSENQEDFNPIGIPDQEMDDDLGFGLQDDLLGFGKPKAKSNKGSNAEDLDNQILTDDLDLVDDEEDDNDDISDIEDFFRNTNLDDHPKAVSKKQESPKKPTKPVLKKTQPISESEEPEEDEEEDDEIFTSGISIGSKSKGTTKSIPKQEPKKVTKKPKQEAVTYEDEEDEDDSYDYDDDDGESAKKKIIKAILIVGIGAITLFLVLSVLGIIPKGNKKEQGQLVTQEQVQEQQAQQQAQQQQAQQQQQATQQTTQNPWSNPVGAGVLDLSKGKIITNPTLNYDTTVYQDQISINKFIEIKNGSLTPKFVGIAKHLGEEIEFNVSMEDYNKYVNGVELTITYVAVIVDQQTFVADIEILQQ